VRAKLPDLADL
jgi:hypothetical protein